MLHKVIILGSGPAGYTAAIYAGRANLRPLLIDGGVGRGQELPGAGGQLMITTEVENYPGFAEGIQGPELMMNMRKQALRFNIELVEDLATKVDLSQRPFKVWVGNTVYEGKTLIIATGAVAKWLGLPEEKPVWEGGLGGAGISACATCDGFFFRGKEVAVVGGGDTAMEEAIYLTNHATKVTVIHRRDTLRASKIMQQRAFSNPKIEFIWDSVVEHVHDPALKRVTGLTLRNVKTGERRELPVSGLFVAIGHKPNTDLFVGQLELDENGYIRTHHDVRTSVYGVFAAGDVQDHEYRQAVTAAGSGCMAAIQAERLLEQEGDAMPQTSPDW
ncbi:thioredoxin-disulfide reductase [Chthonomonas calidirosea]|uniref:Thioredoxin reductase n=1 Tax=Chthonomonas calidirosea (strain DSM 23976 / ICMP 18418 / T49) TaxID=1303518 RepID=S0EXX7_CHTCT|nr:thioredoxin-disulfide reductase [Chthonomonas calidirosea]CCW36369.1 thioredoxin-disulfide reductase [Chthonomonas calidirosea T49]CEK17536.1 thioredoxin-disulfide reductase [Chthonomonas calidirosea]